LADAYEVILGVIDDASITTSATTASSFLDNVATITFIPTTAIPFASGLIEIDTPVWASLLGSDLISSVESYQISDQDFACTSDSFTSMTQSIENGKLSLSYTDLVSGQTDEVVITCTNWRNPVEPEIISGYSIKVYDID